MTWADVFCLMAAAPLLLGAGAMAAERRVLEKAFPADPEVKAIHLTVDVSAAEVDLAVHSGDTILAGRFRYRTSTSGAPEIRYEKSGSSADIELRSRKVKSTFNLDSDDQTWDLSLSQKYTWDIALDIGVSEASMDFTDLPLRSLKLDVGVSECHIRFERPNPETLADLEIDAGVGSLTITGLGYANFDQLSFDGGTGKYVLNFEGLKEGRRNATISVGVGQVRIELPKGVPVQIETDDGFLNSVDIRKLDLEEVDDNLYQTPDFGKVDAGFKIKLDIGLGKAVITETD